MTTPTLWPPGASEIELPHTSRASPPPTVPTRNVFHPPRPSPATLLTIPAALQELQPYLPVDPANSLSQALILRLPKIGQDQLLGCILEVLWRVKALHAQIKPEGAILFEPLRSDGSPTTPGCGLCGDPLPPTARWHCAACVTATGLVLGYLTLEEWLEPWLLPAPSCWSPHYVVMRYDSAGNLLPETDLLHSPAHTLVNPVNCVGVMGKGLAAQMKAAYPEMFARYQRQCQAGRFRPGMLWPYRSQDHLILCAATKDHYQQVSRLEWIKGILERIVQHYERLDMQSLALPRLGCGEGKLPWSRVGPLMARYLRRLPCEVWLYVDEGDPQFD
jgi:O-acetyl-ADP-ribose deacetylase (regulator of RNase III)